MTRERRQFSRVKFSGRVFLIKEDLKVEAQLLDISMRGALVELASPVSLKTGDSCQFEFHLNESDLILEIKASLVYDKDLHLGFRFIEMELDVLTHLRRLIELNIGDPERVQKELFFFS